MPPGTRTAVALTRTRLEVGSGCSASTRRDATTTPAAPVRRTAPHQHVAAQAPQVDASPSEPPSSEPSDREDVPRTGVVDGSVPEQRVEDLHRLIGHAAEADVVIVDAVDPCSHPAGHRFRSASRRARPAPVEHVAHLACGGPTPREIAADLVGMAGPAPARRAREIDHLGDTTRGRVQQRAGSRRCGTPQACRAL